MESTEHSPALGELEGQEADDVECGLSHGTTADGNTGADALRRGGDVGKVQSLLSHLGHLTLDGELHVVDAVGDNLCASHAGQHLQVVGQFDAGHLGVDDRLNLHGDQTASLQVGLLVLVGAAGDGVGEDGGCVGCTLVGEAVSNHLTQLLALVLAALDGCELGTRGESLSTG